MFDPELAILDASPASEDEVIGRLCAGGYPEARSRRAGRRRGTWFDAYVDASKNRAGELVGVDVDRVLATTCTLLAWRS